MYLSFSLRVLIDAEALNMVESVENYTRHRREPLVMKKGRYIIRHDPAISGEALGDDTAACSRRLSRRLQ
ncbi:hypothetical protein [Pyrobaculum aerophilum]|uniref:Uncharacterized protein n=1 Tax=Pyrobaculum aerophilum TaxID=13773 RepID=A0A371R520_9CREN|nr:hypothetical protein CGL51_13465 [Pyrobaculum aerophilum]RFA99177.1 hypothetical protein CGL52_04890 [Pyrobaculum aerophilum]